MGTPFGWLKEIEYKEVTEELKMGDRIIFYTDGLIEERNSNGDMFGFRNFTDIALKLRKKPVDEFADELLIEVRNWANKGPDESLYDDITLIVLDYF
jgi:sigma-B regulation protein RsbU (phosphoserine phosphatase)